MLKYKYIRIAYALLSSILILVFMKYGGLYIYILLLLCLCYLGLIIYGSFAVSANFFLEMYHRGDVKDQVLALTFDDGPTEETIKILDLLKRHEIKATFFVIGKRVAEHKEILQRMVSEGHVIGNHTYHHSNVTGFYSLKKLENEFIKTAQVVYEAVGLKMKLFRPPFGVTSPNMAKVASKFKLIGIAWNIRSFDTTSRSASSIVDSVLKQVKQGSILLFHDDRAKTPMILEDLIPQLIEKNYRFVTVPELLNIEAYTNE